MKDRAIYVRVADAEYRAMAEAAEREHRSLASFVRAAALDRAASVEN